MCDRVDFRSFFLLRQVRVRLRAQVVKTPDLLHMEVKGHVITSMGVGAPGEY